MRASAGEGVGKCMMNESHKTGNRKQLGIQGIEEKKLTATALRSHLPHHRHPSSLPTDARFRHLLLSQRSAQLLPGANLVIVESALLVKYSI